MMEDEDQTENTSDDIPTTIRLTINQTEQPKRGQEMHPVTTAVIAACQRTIARTGPNCAKEAKVVLSNDNITVSDDLGNNQTWATIPKPEEKDRMMEAIRSYPAPTNVKVQLIVKEKRDDEEDAGRKTYLRSIGDNDIKTGFTANSEYLVHLEKQNYITTFTVLNPDGTTQWKSVHPCLSMRSTANLKPGTPIEYRYIAITAEPSMASKDPDANTIEQILDTAFGMFCTMLEDLNEGPGQAWTDYAYPLEDIQKFSERLPQPPSLTVPIPAVPHGHHETPTTTPQLPIALNVKYPAANSVAHAWHNFSEAKGTLVENELNPDAFELVLIQTIINEINGSFTIIPGPPTTHSKEHKQRFNSTRLERVKDITFHLTLKRQGREIAKYEIPSWIYTDYSTVENGNDHEVVLVSQDSKLSKNEIRAIVGIQTLGQYNPHRVNEAFHEHVVGTLAGINEPQTSAKRILEVAAEQIDLLNLDKIPGKGPIKATSGNTTIAVKREN